MDSEDEEERGNEEKIILVKGRNAARKDKREKAVAAKGNGKGAAVTVQVKKGNV